MYSFLIVIIYLAFIGLGLPDSMIGSAWPVMHVELSVPVSYAGIITMIISGGTIVSSLLSDRLTKKLGTGLVTAISVLMTAVALLGFSFSDSFILLCLWAIPFGLGAGAVDAALNNYVALHYSSRFMSWLHCFWGVGAAFSPYIMGYCLLSNAGWQGGYRSVGTIQVVLTAILFLSLPMWKKRVGTQEIKKNAERPKRLTEVFRIKGVPYVLGAFFAYCTVESTAGLWASSYLVQYRGIDVETAARFASLFYLGITFGRFLSGFVADRLGDKRLIRIGIITALIGVLCIAIPVQVQAPALIGLMIVGLGCAPVYPSIIHSTPSHFGKENSQAVIGVQMASAYVGTTFMPPLFGLLASHIGIGWYPWYMFLFGILMLVLLEVLNKMVAKMLPVKE